MADTETIYIATSPIQESIAAGGHGWIQWKGTNVCMDITCKCGEHDHIDAEFLYAVTCRACGATFAVGQNVELIEMPPGQKFFWDTPVAFGEAT